MYARPRWLYIVRGFAEVVASSLFKSLFGIERAKHSIVGSLAQHCGMRSTYDFSIQASVILTHKCDKKPRRPGDMVNFTECEANFLSNETSLALYSYTGPIQDDVPGEHYITRHGCNILCGSGPEFYRWRTSADAILTWVLPMLVMFLLAPFEPRQTRNAILSTIRWLGSPLMFMWCILCNIQVTGRCAHMVDMSVPYHTAIEEGTEASDLRDAMLILGTMNQFLLDSQLVDGSDEQSRCAEQVLRMALFSKLETLEGSLQERRYKVATATRTHRRGGMVPILLGLVWFMFVLALSINFSKPP
jgi:hypothetical protein